jgi:hypothetical protein
MSAQAHALKTPRPYRDGERLRRADVWRPVSAAGARDRRLRRRFTLELGLAFRVIDHGQVVDTGSGWTTDVSSGGIAFQTGSLVKMGAMLELSLHWPAVLDDGRALQLVVLGRVRRTGERVVITVDRYQFRTRTRAVHAANAHATALVEELVQDRRTEIWAGEWRGPDNFSVVR